MITLRTKEISQPNVLVVEGPDDSHFFAAFVRHLELRNVQIVDIGGKTQYRNRLGAVTKLRGFAENAASLALVRDANSDPSGAFQSVRDALDALGLHAPPTPLLLGGSNPQVIVTILPGPGQPGTLEDLCLKTVHGDAAMACVQRYFECLQGQGVPWPRQLSKAKVQAFLASRPEADARPGIAAERGYWPWDADILEDVKTFLQTFASQ